MTLTENEKSLLGILILPMIVLCCIVTYLFLSRAYTASVDKLIRKTKSVPMPPEPIEQQAKNKELSTLVLTPLDDLTRQVELIDQLPRVKRQRWLRNLVFLVAIVAVAMVQSRFPYFDAEAVTVSGSPAGQLPGIINTIFFLALTAIGWAIGRSQLSPFGVWLIPSSAVVFAIFGAIATFTVSDLPVWGRILIMPVWSCLILIMGYFLFFLFRLAQRVLRLSPNYSALWWGWLFATSTTLIEHHKPRFQNDTGILHLGLIQLSVGIVGLLVVILILPRMLSAPISPAPRLLFLRTFGHAKRTQLFLKHFAKQWLEVGPIFMVCAPDTANTAMDVESIAAWMRGKLRSHFVCDTQDLDKRLKRRNIRYRDGRYPIVEIPCLGDTWQQTVEHLAGQIDLAVMDLRSFGAQNISCTFELNLLLTRHASTPTILLVDQETDIGALEQVAQAARQYTKVENTIILELPSGDSKEMARQVAAVVAQAAANEG